MPLVGQEEEEEEQKAPGHDHEEFVEIPKFMVNTTNSTGLLRTFDSLLSNGTKIGSTLLYLKNYYGYSYIS